MVVMVTVAQAMAWAPQVGQEPQMAVLQPPIQVVVVVVPVLTPLRQHLPWVALEALRIPGLRPPTVQPLVQAVEAGAVAITRSTPLVRRRLAAMVETTVAAAVAEVANVLLPEPSQVGPVVVASSSYSTIQSLIP